MPRKTYDAEFKLGAVKLVTEENLTKSEAARRLGVTPTTLGTWVRELAPAGEPVDVQLRDENRRLKEENRQLKMEREILKKATAFFASEK